MSTALQQFARRRAPRQEMDRTARQIDHRIFAAQAQGVINDCTEVLGFDFSRDWKMGVLVGLVDDAVSRITSNVIHRFLKGLSK